MLGAKLGPEIIDKTLANRDAFVRALFERPDSFSKILPYAEYLSEAGIFVLKDGAIIQRGNHEELIAAGGLYAELCEIQFGTGDPVTELKAG